MGKAGVSGANILDVLKPSVSEMIFILPSHLIIVRAVNIPLRRVIFCASRI